MYKQNRQNAYFREADWKKIFSSILIGLKKLILRLTFGKLIQLIT